jgi:hypothetical protein
MINFYKLYNRNGLDKEEYRPLLGQLMDDEFTVEMKIIEHLIKKNPRHAYSYTKKFIYGRWEEAEPVIKTSVSCAYAYARDVIKGRWIEAESVIMTDAYFAFRYAMNIIKGRWEEAEPYIKKEEDWWERYRLEFGI